MRLTPLLLAAILLAAAPARARDAEAPDPLRTGLEGALRGCETWILDPSSWTGGPAPFLAAIDLDGRVSEVERLPEPLLPPDFLRQGLRYWRIAAGGTNGYALTVSRDLPMCHVAGGGDRDLQPFAEAAVAAPEFRARWEFVEVDRRDGIVSTLFRSREDTALTLLLSRADAPGARTDRVQVIATATYDLER